MPQVIELSKWTRPPRGRARRRRIHLRQYAGILGLAVLATFGYVTFGPVATDAVPATFFAMCDQSPHSNCVIDGDTFYLGSQSIRVSDIDTPETHPPRCEHERMLGAEATRRLRVLLNMGSFELQTPGRDEDQYGRKLRVVVRDGRSLGSILVSEGLAREWIGRREPWC